MEAYSTLEPGATGLIEGRVDAKESANLIGCWRGQLILRRSEDPEGKMSDDVKKRSKNVIRAGGLYVMVSSVGEIVDWVQAMRTVSNTGG